MTMRRRVFLKAGACALLAAAMPPRFLVRVADAAAGRRKVLVAIFQRGAVDGLSMVAPYGDPAYAAARPGIALKPPSRGDSERAIDLDGFFALHPSLAPLMPLWDARALAIVHACGSPDVTRSHFDAQDYMETGTPGVKSTVDGWLSRTVDAASVPASPFRAVAMGPSLPRSLRGAARAIAIPSLERFDVSAPTPMPAGASTSAMPGGGDDLVRATEREMLEAVRALKASGAVGLSPQNGADYPRGRLGDALRQVAQLVRADIGLEVAFVDVGGWDTHVGQGAERGILGNRLRDFGGAIAAFARDLGDRMSDVVVLTMSEFGRTVAENGSRGTDHGHATAMLVLGGGVRGGKVYGRWPGLAREQRFDARDLAVTTDFRALFAEVAGRHLGVAQPASLFPGWRDTSAAPGIFA